jgi:hypothetical protein
MIKATQWLAGAAVLVAVGLVGRTAWSGKPERDKIEELGPHVADAVASVKADCGCDVAVSVKFDTYPDASSMSGVTPLLTGLKGAAKSHCAKPADKQALCSSLSAVEITYSGEAPIMVGKTLKAHSEGGSHSGEHDLSELFDHF